MENRWWQFEQREDGEVIRLSAVKRIVLDRVSNTDGKQDEYLQRIRAIDKDVVALRKRLTATYVALGRNELRRSIARSMFITVVIALCMSTAHAYTDEQLANAIFKAEGGYKARYLYGIVSVKYSNEAEARRICLNTIRNNRARFENQEKFDDYLEFLASRYCPIGADNDPRGLNVNWLKNVRYFLNTGV